MPDGLAALFELVDQGFEGGCFHPLGECAVADATVLDTARDPDRTPALHESIVVGPDCFESLLTQFAGSAEVDQLWHVVLGGLCVPGTVVAGRMRSVVAAGQLSSPTCEFQ